MNSSVAPTPFGASQRADISRLDFLDATRAYALVLGIVFHASLSFMPVFMGWAVQDISTGPLVVVLVTVSHSFRLELFFLLAGFFARVTLHRKGIADFARTRLLRIVVPFVVGWFLLRPLMVSGWVMGSASLRGDVDFWAGIRGGFESLTNLPAGMFHGTHLWFLYYLATITTLLLMVRGLMALSGSWYDRGVLRADALVAWLANSGFSLPVLVVPTAVTLLFMHFWGMDTPDQGLRPHIPVLIIYGGFFVLGWMLSRQRELIRRFARLTPLRWILAGIGIGAILWLGKIERDFSHPYRTLAHVVYAVTYALTMWSLVFLSLGVFAKLCGRPRFFIRYLADSSYWMYLIHLPIVIWLQVAVAEIPVHWCAKLAFISTVTIAVSLITYDLFVRSTFVGWVLNGQRCDRVLVPLVLRSLPRLLRDKQLMQAT